MMSDRIQLLMLRRNTKVTKLLDKVAKPKRALPVNAPPEWQQLALDSLIPMFEWPARSLTFSRNKIGEEIFASAGAEFDLSDPYCQTVSFDYEPLHDQNLKKSFLQSKYIKRFRNIGILTDSNEVICTLKQFNEYRRYLKRLYLNKVNRIRAKNDENEIDIRRFAYAQKTTTKFMAMCKRKEIVAEKRRKHQSDVRSIIAERKAKFTRSKQKYDDTLERFENIQKAKRLEIHRKSQMKEFKARERRHQLRQLEKTRIILMRRKLSVEGDLILHRRRHRQLSQQRLKSERIQCNWHKKMMWQIQSQIQNNHLMTQHEKQTAYKIMQRTKAVAVLQEKILLKTTLKRANLIRERYPKRNQMNITAIFWHEIKKLANQRNGNLIIKSHEDEIESTDESSLKSSIKPSIASRATLSSTSKTKLTAHSKNGFENPSDLYEPQVAPTVDPDDTTPGYCSLNKADISLAVQSSFESMNALRGQVVTVKVILEANEILQRISRGYTIDIPRDNSIMMLVQIHVDKIFKRVRLSQLEKIEVKLKQHKSLSDTTTEGSLTKNCKYVSFGDTFIISTSAYAEDVTMVKSVKLRPPTRGTSIRKLVKAVLENSENNIQPTIPEDFQNRSVQHLYEFQKCAILSNLERLEKNLNFKIEQNILNSFNFRTLKLVNINNVPAYEYGELIELATDSVLTLPEKDSQFANRILFLSKAFTDDILRKMEQILRDLINQ